MNLTAYHFVSLFRNNVQQYPQKDALMGRDAASQWKGITWETLGNTKRTEQYEALKERG